MNQPLLSNEFVLLSLIVVLGSAVITIGSYLLWVEVIVPLRTLWKRRKGGSK